MTSKYELSLEDDENMPRNPLLSTATQDSESGGFKRHFGNNKVFCFYNGEPLFNLGPQRGIFFFCLIIFEMIGILVYVSAASYQPEEIQLIFVALMVLEALTYIYSALKNPGIHTAKTHNEVTLKDFRKNQNFCARCRILREPKTVHCSDCNVCIRGYDHHCPWTGKCVGAGNLYGFYLFLIITSAYFVFCIGLVLLRIFDTVL